MNLHFFQSQVGNNILYQKKKKRFSYKQMEYLNFRKAFLRFEDHCYKSRTMWIVREAL